MYIFNMNASFSLVRTLRAYEEWLIYQMSFIYAIGNYPVTVDVYIACSAHNLQRVEQCQTPP